MGTGLVHTRKTYVAVYPYKRNPNLPEFDLYYENGKQTQGGNSPIHFIESNIGGRRHWIPKIIISNEEPLYIEIQNVDTIAMKRLLSSGFHFEYDPFEQKVYIIYHSTDQKEWIRPHKMFK